MTFTTFTFTLAIAVTLTLTLGASSARAELRARVVDVGPGLCVIIEEGSHVVVYDAGHWNGKHCKAALDTVMTSGPAKKIRLLVLSHSDADHVGDAASIISTYPIERVLHTGYRTGTVSATYQNALNAIAQATANGTTKNMTLQTDPILPGATFTFGEMLVTFVAGWKSPPSSWGLSQASHKNNAVSVIVRVVYAGKTILLGGDSYGRDIGDPWGVCEAAEAEMVKRTLAIPIDSDVLVAPHHGADNASSTCFIKAVTPDFVVFSAGHDHEHPTNAAATRYTSATIGNVRVQNIFRTDRGDNEGGDEWSVGATSAGDSSGDDDVLITITPTGALAVAYAP